MTAESVSTIPITRSCPYAPSAEHLRLRELQRSIQIKP